MKRLLCVVVLGVVATSCSQQTAAAAANLRGANDIVLIDKLLFTTSTDRDELRVLDLVPANVVLGGRAYLRAPNPLEALAIPVLGRPSSLARDIRYDDVKDAAGTVTIAKGREVGGPWVYATRSGGSEISVVGGGPASDPTQLSEAKRIPTAGIVTAAAGSGRAPAASRLYFATWNGDTATLQAIDLPATVAGLKALTTAQLSSTQKIVGTLPGEVVVDLLVMPPVAMRGICETTECLAVATRRDQGRAGRVLLFDPETRAVRELHFPGPVRKLAILAGTRAAGTYVPPGLRVFAILDEEKMGCGSTDCGGVIAVDTFTGEVAIDATGLPMLPITTGSSLPTGLTVTARGQLLLPPHLLPPGSLVPTVVEVSALGVITTSTGAVVFFDAAGLGHFDMNGTPTGAGPLNVGLYTPEGILAPIDSYVSDGSKGGPIFDKDGNGITLANGAWKSEVIDIVVKGFLPGLADQAVPDSDPKKKDFYGDRVAIARARVGDTLVFRLPDNSLCTTPITSVGDGFVTGGNLTDTACVGRKRWAVRAAGADNYVVTGSLTGYLGRTGAGKTFTYKGTYFQRFPPFDPAAPTFSVALGPEAPELAEDWRWSIDVQPNLTNFSMKLDSQALGCSTNVAGAVVYDFDRTRVFFALPSANSIIDVNMSIAHPGGAVSDVGYCYP